MKAKDVEERGCEAETKDKTIEDLENAGRRLNSKILYRCFKKL